jgi:hypothetical protein
MARPVVNRRFTDERWKERWNDIVADCRTLAHEEARGCAKDADDPDRAYRRAYDDVFDRELADGARILKRERAQDQSS